jgi:hypothetical protein
MQIMAGISVDFLHSLIRGISVTQKADFNQTNCVMAMRPQMLFTAYVDSCKMLLPKFHLLTTSSYTQGIPRRGPGIYLGVSATIPRAQDFCSQTHITGRVSRCQCPVALYALTEVYEDQN